MTWQDAYKVAATSRVDWWEDLLTEGEGPALLGLFLTAALMSSRCLDASCCVAHPACQSDRGTAAVSLEAAVLSDTSFGVKMLRGAEHAASKE